MENRVSGEALFRSQPMKRSVGDGSCLYQSFGHYISQLVDGINLMDIDFTLGIAFSLHMFTEEVEHHRKELALGSNLGKSCHSKGSIVVFKDVRLGSGLHIVISSNHLAIVLTSLFIGSMSLIVVLNATYFAIIVETLVSVCKEQPARRIT